MGAAPTPTISSALPVPRALDEPDPRRCFSPAAMGRRIRALFIISRPTVTPAISVHANLMRFFAAERVEVHVAYNRRADQEPYRSSGSSVLDVLPGAAGVHLRPTEFGPVGHAPRLQLVSGAARAALPGLRDAVVLAAYVRRHRIDVIHCEEGVRNAPYGLALARTTQARSVVHFHLTYGSWMSPISRFAVRHADAVIPVSHATGRGLASGGVDPDRIFPVLNGIDVSAFDPAAADGSAVRHELGMGPGDPLVLMAAQLAEWKRQHLLIEAFRPVLERHPTARLVLAGTEWKPAERYAAGLERLIGELGLTDRVILAGFRRDIRDVLAAADVFAHPSVGEPFGLVLAEAMAMGKPVVTVADGGAPEVVIAGEAGLVGPKDDVAALTANLLALIDDADLRAAMGARGRARVQQRLNCRRMADDIEAVYRRVCRLPTEPDTA